MHVCNKRGDRLETTPKNKSYMFYQFNWQNTCISRCVVGFTNHAYLKTSVTACRDQRKKNMEQWNTSYIFTLRAYIYGKNSVLSVNNRTVPPGVAFLKAHRNKQHYEYEVNARMYDRSNPVVRSW